MRVFFSKEALFNKYSGFSGTVHLDRKAFYAVWFLNRIKIGISLTPGLRIRQVLWDQGHQEMTRAVVIETRDAGELERMIKRAATAFIVEGSEYLSDVATPYLLEILNAPSLPRRRSKAKRLAAASKHLHSKMFGNLQPI